MLVTAPRQPVGRRKPVAGSAATRKPHPHARNSAAQHEKRDEPAITVEAIDTPMVEQVDVFDKAFVEGSPLTADVIVYDSGSEGAVSANQTPTLANLQATPVIPEDEEIGPVENVPDTISIEQQSTNAEPDASQGFSDTVQADQGPDLGEELSSVVDQLSPEQKAQIALKIKKLLGDSVKAKKEIVDGYRLYAKAWFEENEYGHRHHGSESALAEMERFLNAELPEMLKVHSGRVARGWRLNLWAAAAGGAGLLPYGKPVVGAVARLRTKQIISEKFAIAKIPSKKAIKKAEKKAKKAKKAKKSSKDKKKEQAMEVAKIVAQQAASELIDAAVDVPKEAASSAFNEMASDVAQSAVGDAVSEFLSDLSSEMFFGSAAELIHFLPFVGQAYSAYKGYRKTSKQCKIDINDAVSEALKTHGGTTIPETISQMKGDLEKSGPRSSITITRLPSCAACFLSQTDPSHTRPCEHCITHSDASHSSLTRKFRRCQSGHDKRIPHQKSGLLQSLFTSKSYAPKHAHHKAWCTKALLSKSTDPAAWECIPCFLKYGAHKQSKCLLKHKGACTYCGVKGHHPGGCGMRFFHAVSVIQDRQATGGIGREVQDGVLAVGHKRVEWVRIGGGDFGRKQVWSKIDSHVVVLGENFGGRERYESACPLGMNFGEVGRGMR